MRRSFRRDFGSFRDCRPFRILQVDDLPPTRRSFRPASASALAICLARALRKFAAVYNSAFAPEAIHSFGVTPFSEAETTIPL